jgi:transcriptional regulator with XRE-family HTH domain
MSPFREVLRTRRKRAGLTQQALAEKAGIDHSYVSKMETEEYYPTRDVALSLAAAFGLSGQDKFDFLLDARVASKEDWEELERFKTANDEAVKPKQQASSPLIHSTSLSAIAPPLKRRRSGALPSPPIEEPSPVSDSVEFRAVGQDIDKEIEGLSQEECDIVREFLVPQARQLKRLIKLCRGE